MMRKLLLMLLCSLAFVSCQDAPMFVHDGIGSDGAPRSPASTRALEDLPNTIGTSWLYDVDAGPVFTVVHLQVIANQANSGGYRDQAILDVERNGVHSRSTIDYSGDSVFFRYWNLKFVFPLAIGREWGYYTNGRFDRARVEDTVSVTRNGMTFSGVFVINVDLLAIPRTVLYVPKVGIIRCSYPGFSLKEYRIASPVHR